jgi:ASC-1-like (ASCH) protein
MKKKFGRFSNPLIKVIPTINKSMAIHKMKLAAAPFEKIASGSKVIESRLHDEKRQQINLGDQIEFVCNDDRSRKVVTAVKALYRYPSFANLFSDFCPSLFGGASKDDLIKEIETFYSKEEQEKYGVVGIKIELVK